MATSSDQHTIKPAETAADLTLKAALGVLRAALKTSVERLPVVTLAAFLVSCLAVLVWVFVFRPPGYRPDMEALGMAWLTLCFGFYVGLILQLSAIGLRREDRLMAPEQRPSSWALVKIAMQPKHLAKGILMGLVASLLFGLFSVVSVSMILVVADLVDPISHAYASPPCVLDHDGPELCAPLGPYPHQPERISIGWIFELISLVLFWPAAMPAICHHVLQGGTMGLFMRQFLWLMRRPLFGLPVLVGLYGINAAMAVGLLWLPGVVNDWVSSRSNALNLLIEFGTPAVILAAGICVLVQLASRAGRQIASYDAAYYQAQPEAATR